MRRCRPRGALDDHGRYRQLLWIEPLFLGDGRLFESAGSAGFSSRGNAPPRAHARLARKCPLVIASRAEGQVFADACAREVWRLARKPEVVEDFSHEDAVADQCDELAPLAAVRALEHIDGKNAKQHTSSASAQEIPAHFGK